MRNAQNIYRIFQANERHWRSFVASRTAALLRKWRSLKEHVEVVELILERYL